MPPKRARAVAGRRARGASTPGGSSRSGNRGGNRGQTTAGRRARGASSRGASTRGASTRGAATRGGSSRGGNRGQPTSVLPASPRAASPAQDTEMLEAAPEEGQADHGDVQQPTLPGDVQQSTLSGDVQKSTLPGTTEVAPGFYPQINETVNTQFPGGQVFDLSFDFQHSTITPEQHRAINPYVASEQYQQDFRNARNANNAPPVSTSPPRNLSAADHLMSTESQTHNPLPDRVPSPLQGPGIGESIAMSHHRYSTAFHDGMAALQDLDAENVVRGLEGDFTPAVVSPSELQFCLMQDDNTLALLAMRALLREKRTATVDGEHWENQVDELVTEKLKQIDREEREAEEAARQAKETAREREHEERRQAIMAQQHAQRIDREP